jgi:SAM-dependent methyltransferase
MEQELLELIKCSYCGSDFEIGEVYEENSGEIINGCIKCECDTYPILEGILILKKDNMKKYILELLKKKNIREAVAFSLGEHIGYTCDIMTYLESGAHYTLNKILFALVRHRIKSTYKKYSGLSFCEVLGRSSYETYLKHRFSAASFWSLYPFIPLLKRNKERILDLGCGAGHASFVISTYVKPEELVCADHTFKSLYLAKKYFVKDAQFICLDANYPLPFKNDIFTSILMIDAFHYVKGRALLAGELERTLRHRSLLLLLHLHNSLVCNTRMDESLPPVAWVNLFKENELEIKAIPERRIIENFLLNNELNLVEEHSEKELNLSNAISIIMSKDKTLFRVYDKVDSDLLSNKSNLVINPFYKTKEEGDKILLKRDFPSESFRKEYPLTEKYLPEKCEIDKRIVKGRSVYVSAEDDIEIEDLMRKFVVINVPEKYV